MSQILFLACIQGVPSAPPNARPIRRMMLVKAN